MFKQVLNRKLIASISQGNAILKKPFFSWLTKYFNSVDNERIKEVGPDRACAEWLLKNGAVVKWKGSTEYLRNYDVLMELKEQKYIQAVDATDSGITHEGFPHFDGCKHIEEVKLVKCLYICNEAMYQLSYLKESLNYLEVISCRTVTDEGLVALKNLKNLKILKLEDLPYVKDKEAVKRELTEGLPNVKIEFM